MASVKKTTLSLKPSVNPKIATTTLIKKPVVKQPLVSKASNSTTVKKLAFKTTLEKVTTVEPTTTLKPISKSSVSSSLLKMSVKATVPSSPVKTIATVKKAADSTNIVKAKPVLKSSVKTLSLSVFKPVSAVKSSTKSIAQVATSTTGSVLKKPAINSVKPAEVMPVVSEKSIVPKVKPANTMKASTLKSSPAPTTKSSSAPSIKSHRTTTKTTTTAVKKNPQSTKTLQLLSTSSVKSSTGVKTTLKSPTPTKATSKTASLAPKAVQTIRSSVAVKNVIKRLQDETKIEIRDADSTTVEKEKKDERDTMNQCDENGSFKQESDVDEKRVYAVAEQLIGVMQPEQLEVITRDVVQHRNRDSYIIDMGAVETDEVKEMNDVGFSVSETSPPLIDSSKENLHSELQVENETEINPAEKHMIFEMYEMKMQKIVDCHRSNNTCENTTKDETTEIVETCVDDKPEDYCNKMSVTNENLPMVLSESLAIIERCKIDTDKSKEISEFVEQELTDVEEQSGEIPAAINESALAFDTETSEDSTETILENEINLKNTCFTYPKDHEVDSKEKEVDPSLDRTESVETNAPSMADLNEDDLSEVGQRTKGELPVQVLKSEECEECLPAVNVIDDVSNENNDNAEDCEETADERNTSSENLPAMEPAAVECNENVLHDLINLKSDIDEKIQTVSDDEVYIDNDLPCNNETKLINFDVPPVTVSDDSLNEPELEIADNGLLMVNRDVKNSLTTSNSEVFDDTNMSYADILQSFKSTIDDSLEILKYAGMVDECQPLKNADDNNGPAIQVDETSDSIFEVVSVDAGVRPLIYSLYDNTEFPDAIPSDEHYEKQDHEHEVDQHEETFHKIRHKRNKRRNKKNRKSSNSENFEEQTSKHVYNDKPNYQEEYHHGRRRNSRRWRNSRGYAEAFYQHQQNHHQEYYADPHWKYTAKMD